MEGVLLEAGGDLYQKKLDKERKRDEKGEQFECAAAGGVGQGSQDRPDACGERKTARSKPEDVGIRAGVVQEDAGGRIANPSERRWITEQGKFLYLDAF